MLTTLEIAIAVIAIAWLLLIAALGIFYVRIDRERRELREISKKVDHTEKSIKEIHGLFAALKALKSSA